METLNQLAGALSDEAFAEYRAVHSTGIGRWWSTKSEAERDAESFRYDGLKKVSIERRVND